MSDAIGFLRERWEEELAVRASLESRLIAIAGLQVSAIAAGIAILALLSAKERNDLNEALAVATACLVGASVLTSLVGLLPRNHPVAAISELTAVSDGTIEVDLGSELVSDIGHARKGSKWRAALLYVSTVTLLGGVGTFGLMMATGLV